jgi:hypothetical protein
VVLRIWYEEFQSAEDDAVGRFVSCEEDEAAEYDFVGRFGCLK